MKKILINVSNLHSGGGAQVAASFIYELSKMFGNIDLKQVSVVCSTAVNLNLPETTDRSVFKCFDIINIKGFSRPKPIDKKLFDGFDICFSVFGPVYFKIDVKKHVCGFAQAWIAYPDNEAYSLLGFKDRMIYRFRFFIQKQYFKSYDQLIVEASHIKNALLNLGFKNEIEVVNNTISSVFNESVNTKETEVNDKNVPLLGFIGKPYEHKNIKILKLVHSILEEKYSFKCDFVFTLSHDEMNLCGFSELNAFHTVGEISLNQCPSFYERIDALIFPSLLECFSASPIEAMKMKVPVFASDRMFVKDFCQDAAFYFEPTDPEDIAKVVFSAFQKPALMQEKKNLGENVIANLFSAQERAEAYVRQILK